MSELQRWYGNKNMNQGNKSVLTYVNGFKGDLQAWKMAGLQPRHDADDANFLFQNPAKVLQNLRNFGALCAAKLRGLGQRALRKSCDVAAAFGEVES